MADSSPIDVIDQLVTHHKADFIIIDTFNAFFGFEEGSGNAYQNDAKQIKPIHNLAKRLGIGLLVVHHTRKNRTGGFNDVNGSNAFLGGFDVNIQCTQDRISTQSRILMDTYINIVFNKATLCWEEGNSGNDDPMRRAFEQIIKDELRQGMKPMKALISAVMTAESVNYSAKYTAKRIGEMVNEGFLTTQDGGKKQVYGIKDRPY
jgi:predicted transcriptional regulator